MVSDAQKTSSMTNTEQATLTCGRSRATSRVQRELQLHFVDPDELREEERRIFDRCREILGLVGITGAPPIRSRRRCASDSTRPMAYGTPNSGDRHQAHSAGSLAAFAGTLLHEPLTRRPARSTRRGSSSPC